MPAIDRKQLLDEYEFEFNEILYDFISIYIKIEK
jgi:hypothetical protein